MVSIGRKVAAARSLRGTKSVELAAKLGWSPQRLHRIERSENITIRTLEQIAQALRMSVAQILTIGEGAEEMTKNVRL